MDPFVVLVELTGSVNPHAAQTARTVTIIQHLGRCLVRMSDMGFQKFLLDDKKSELTGLLQDETRRKNEVIEDMFCLKGIVTALKKYSDTVLAYWE